MSIRSLLEKLNIYVYRAGKENFFTYWTRPKYCKDVQIKVADDENVAIIIQGPIKYEDDFTVETVRLYRKIYSNCKVIVSTWSNENPEVLEQIHRLGAELCISDLPHKKGLDYSINLQRMNTLKGIERAKELGYEFVAKTRSDQRVYANTAMSFCKKMIESFPFSGKESNIKGRIVSTSMGTFKERYYNISDLFLFGYTEDILRYYCCPEDEREHTVLEPAQNLLEYSKRVTGEIWFSTHYLEAVGHELKWTDVDSNCAIKEYYIILDAESLDLFWPKYTKEEYMWRTYTKEKLDQVTFSDWFLMNEDNE